ncbi:hypothetical protein MJI37_35500, partial [Salmonella enterica subsp. enterica serovar Cerro]|nr:hypothetical protein [Salmonella enterica subsp. enterica serovar Cerro]
KDKFGHVIENITEVNPVPAHELQLSIDERLQTVTEDALDNAVTLLLVACPLLPFIIMAMFKGNRLPSRSRGAAWVCGYDHEQS